MLTYQTFRDVGRHPIHLELAIPVCSRPHVLSVRGIPRLPSSVAVVVVVLIVLFAVAELELLPATAERTVEDLADKVEAGVVLVDDVVLGLSAAAVQAHFPELRKREINLCFSAKEFGEKIRVGRDLS